MRQTGISTRLRSLAVLAGLAIILAGCAEDSLFGGGGELSGLACPQVAILEAPGELTRFSGGKIGKITDVLFQAKMEVRQAYCDIEDKSIFVTTDAMLGVIRGPAETTGEVKFSFFVAILNGQKEVILRETFPIVVKFEGPKRKILFEDTVSVNRSERKYRSGDVHGLCRIRDDARRAGIQSPMPALGLPALLTFAPALVA